MTPRIADAMEAALTSRFHSPEEKLAVLALISIAHIRDDELALFRDKPHDLPGHIRNVVGTSRNIAEALFDDLVVVNAIEGSDDDFVFLKWQRAIL